VLHNIYTEYYRLFMTIITFGSSTLYTIVVQRLCACCSIWGDFYSGQHKIVRVVHISHALIATDVFWCCFFSNHLTCNTNARQDGCLQVHVS